MNTARKIIELTKPYWRKVLLAIVLGFMSSAILGVLTWLIKPALDIVFVEKRYEYFTFLPLGVVVLFSIKGLLHFGQQYLMLSEGLRLIRDVQDRLHRHILYMPVRYFDREASGVLMSRVINDVKMMGAIFPDVVRAAVIELPKIIVLMGVALYRKWDLTLLSIVLVPAIGYGTRTLGRKVKHRSFRAQSKLSFLTHRLSETIAGIRVIKIFNQEIFRSEKFMGENRSVYGENVKVIKAKEFAKLLTDSFTGVAIGMVLFYGGLQVKQGGITPGDFATIIAAIYFIFAPVKKLGWAYTALQGIKAAVERVEHVLDTPMEQRGGVKLSGSFVKSVRFENLTLQYNPEDAPALSGVDLEILKGEALAVVGPSGSGKTSLINLIPRFYTPTGGRVLIDDIDLKDVELESLRGLIGIVSQDVVLFNDTVEENIMAGNRGAAHEDVVRAARMAYADEFILRMPNGYNTVVGERGLTVSGGQRQRIAIARAILKNPPILILDEATSSLDSVSEALVQKALDGLMKDRTTIIVAHRLSTVRGADRIVVLEGGRILAVGRHEELIESNAVYSKLYRMFSVDTPPGPPVNGGVGRP
jgi:subfamily B ATP-binding cassette protein MsbA